MERNEEEEVQQVPWEGIIPDSVFQEMAERAFLDSQTEG